MKIWEQGIYGLNGWGIYNLMGGAFVAQMSSLLHNHSDFFLHEPPMYNYALPKNSYFAVQRA